MNKKILIVEDELSLSKALDAQFVDEGFDVLHAYDGEEGLHLVEQENPDIVLLDLLMPGMGGEEMLARLRLIEEHKTLPPVIILSNFDTDDTKERIMDKGVCHYLVKADTTLDTIVSKVREVLGN